VEADWQGPLSLPPRFRNHCVIVFSAAAPIAPTIAVSTISSTIAPLGPLAAAASASATVIGMDSYAAIPDALAKIRVKSLTDG
jgi:hypothetical protein